MQIWKAVCGLFHPVPRHTIASDGPGAVDSSRYIPATPHCVRYDFYVPSGLAHYHRDVEGGFHAYEGAACPTGAAEAEMRSEQGERVSAAASM